MQARYGIRGIFVSGKKWRLIAYIAFLLLGFFGGFRAGLILIGLTFLIQFYLEGLHRTQLLPIFAFIGVLATVAMIPLIPKLPFTFQRELSFLPLPVDPLTKQIAKETLDWRYAMWKALWPQVPRYLLVGKGYGFSKEDFTFMGNDTAFHRIADASDTPLALSGDYHNGWLSVLITFGIWGMIVTVWFLAAGVRALYYNFRYGDARLQPVNCFLMASFLTRIVMFMTVSGAGLHIDLVLFVGVLGLSIALNDGVCRPAPQTVQARQPMVHPAKILPRARPAFQR
jgi:O-antigen ligase